MENLNELITLNNIYAVMAAGFLNFCSLGDKLYKFSLGFWPRLITSGHGILGDKYVYNGLLALWLSLMSFMVFITHLLWNKVILSQDDSLMLY